MVTIEIDKNSGFCFGVVYAIEMAEDHLNEHDSLYCLGDIVHNDKEVERLQDLGLKIIDHEDPDQGEVRQDLRFCGWHAALHQTIWPERVPV